MTLQSLFSASATKGLRFCCGGRPVRTWDPLRGVGV